MNLLEQVLGFKDWRSLNESDDSGNVEVYTNFEFPASAPDVLYIRRLGTIIPDLTKMRSSGALPRKIEEMVSTYFSSFEIEKVGQTPMTYSVKTEDGEDFQLNFYDVINSTSFYHKFNIFNFQAVIKEQSVETISESMTRLEYKLKGDFNSIQETEVIPRLLDDVEEKWLGEIDPSDFASELESILISSSIGGDFFGENSIKNLKEDFALYAIYQVYRENIFAKFSVTRDTVDLVNLDQELESKLEELTKQMYSGELNDDQAKETMKFIKYLTIRLRPKGSRVKEKADLVLAKLMTVVDKQGHTKKLMDFLI